MYQRRIHSLLLFSSIVLAGAVATEVTSRSAFAQTSLSGISGTVLDTSGAVVSGAEVEVVNTQTSAKFKATSNGSGYFNFPNLPVGTYRVTVTSAGFKTYTQENVAISVATPIRLNLALAPGSQSENVSVSTSELALDTTSSALGDTLNTKEIESLPMNGRDYARLSLLAPGAVARSRYIADISFDGLHSVHNQYTIDGIDASRVDQPYMANGFERGARLLTGSLETISEFRAQTSGYEAEYGRAAGSIVNIVTKNGTNNWHGTVYDYFRNEAMDSRNYFARQAQKPAFRFNDFGANLSGPIWRDRTFFFANYEGSRQVIGIIGQGTVLSSTARATALNLHPELAPILADMPVGTDTSTNLATYYSVKNTNVREDTGSIRVDHRFSDKDSIFARVNVNDTMTYGPLFGVTTTALGVNDAQNVPLRTTNIAIHETHIFGPNLLNDLQVGMQRWTSRLDSAEDIPQVKITGVDAIVGTRSDYQSNNTSYQYGDNMSLVRGNHTIKWGATYYRVQVNRNGLDLPVMTYTSISNFENNIATQVSQTAGDPGHGTRASQVGTFVQDTWQILPNLTLNYGLRWDWATPPHDKDNSTQTFDLATGELKGKGGEYFKTNWKDFSPRFGLSWGVKPTTVVRSSVGLFYQTYPVGFGAYNVPLNNVSGNWTVTGDGKTSYPGGLGYPYTSFVNSAVAPAPNVYGFPSHKPDIRSLQWNFSVQQQFGKNTTLLLAYVGNHGLNLWRETDVNQYIQFKTVRPNTDFGDIYLENNNGRSGYNGFQASLKERISSSLVLDVNYSWGHGIDDVQDQGLYSSEPQDNNNINAEWGNSSGDVRNNVTYNLLYTLPMGDGHAFLGNSWRPARILASGWSVNSLGLMRSGVADNVYLSNNSYGNSFYTNQRPDRVAGTPMYVSKSVDAATGYVTFLNPNGWTTPQSGTYGNSPRNSVYGPHFTQIDISVVKDTTLHNGHSLQLRAELFNVGNHPNFAFPTTYYAAGSQSFGRISSTYGNTIGFGTARQLQLALKYRF